MFRDLSGISIFASLLVHSYPATCMPYVCRTTRCFLASCKWHGHFKTQSWILVQHACVSEGGASLIGVPFQRDWQLVTVGASRAVRGLRVTTAQNTVAGFMRLVRLETLAMPTARTSYHSLRPKKRHVNGSLIWPGMTGER